MTKIILGKSSSFANVKFRISVSQKNLNAKKSAFLFFILEPLF